MTVKILLDTDIGTDIDDAVCLAYLLANPECELMGITTVTGEAIKRAQMASALCKAAGKDIPIFPGAEDPLLIPQRQTTCEQAAALGGMSCEKDFVPGRAVSFLQGAIRRHPGEIVLLPIGPLTNIGLLFAMDPEIPGLLKGLSLMGGRFSNAIPNLPAAEWNALGDAHATAIVYKHSVAVHRSVGLDVTKQVQMSAAEVRKRFKGPLLETVLQFAEIWFERVFKMRGERNITFHDPLAAATIFDDTICQFKRGTVDVELASERLRGMTHWAPNPEEGRHEVAVAVDPGRFFEHFFSVFQ
jgi:purine nucleosidase